MSLLLSGALSLGLELKDEQVQLFESYYRELLAWNDRMNLTAITDYEEVQTKHFLDSLTVVLAFGEPGLRSAMSVIDVGSGAGFPGIPLKIAFPAFQLTLLEATGKKTVFLKHLVSTLGLSGVEVVTGRAEEVAHDRVYREKYDLATARAVASLPTLLEITLPFCRIGGHFVAQKQAEAKPEVEQASKAAAVLGGRVKDIIDIRLPEIPGDRCLIVYEKMDTTPARFPRRAGEPKKHPLLRIQ